jgi:hypothetical protein
MPTTAGASPPRGSRAPRCPRSGSSWHAPG